MLAELVSIALTISNPVAPGSEKCSAGVMANGELVERNLSTTGAGTWSWLPSGEEFVVCRAEGLQPSVITRRGEPSAEVSLEAGSVLTAEVESFSEESPVTLFGLASDLSPVAVWKLDESVEECTVSSSVLFFRAYRRGMAPVTFQRTVNESTIDRFRVPSSAAGGEIVGLFLRKAITPATIEVLCGESKLSAVVRRNGFFSVGGVPPGVCVAEAQYRGEVRRFPARVQVRPQETTVMREWAAEPVGGIAVSLEAALCETEIPSKVRIARLGGSETTTEYFLQPDVDSCSVYAEGLDPGQYAVGLRASDRALSSDLQIDVVDWKVSEVELLANPVRVMGAVLLGDRPAGRKFYIVFHRGEKQWEVESDDAGAYIAYFPYAGDYLVSVRTTPFFPVANFERKLHVGEQQQDFLLGGGAISVRVVDETGERVRGLGPVQIVMQGPGGATSGFIRDDEEDAAFFGLSFGKYRIRAFTAADYASKEDVEVELRETSPKGFVEIVLLESAGSLVVTSETGEPLPAATVRAGMAILSEEQPGVFSLSRVPIGETLLISKPGSSPVCVNRRSAGGMAVALRSGTFVARIALDAAASGLSLGSLSSLPGSECPVPLLLVGATTMPMDSGIMVELTGLESGRYSYSHPALSSPIWVTVPGDAVIVRLK